MIYLIGAPGTGKTTLMDKLTARFVRVPRYAGPVAHDLLADPVSGQVRHAEIGKRRAQFAGTDALNSAVITAAVPWISGRPFPVILAEGARLANRRFLSAAAAAGYDVTVVLLEHADAQAWRTRRAERIGKTQNASWVSGRITASRNLADNPPPGVAVLRGHPDDLAPRLHTLIL
jgi:hypothetical protein